LLEDYERTSSIEIAIVLMHTLDGYPIEDYAFQLGEKWGIGKSGTDNGALMLISVEEHKLWVATGYGLEGSLPDGLVHRIIKNDIVPNFQQNNYHGGLRAGVEAIMLATKGEYKGQKKINPVKTTGLIVLILFIFIIVWLVKGVQVRNYAKMNHLSFWAAWASAQQHPVHTFWLMVRFLWWSRSLWRIFRWWWRWWFWRIRWWKFRWWWCGRKLVDEPLYSSVVLLFLKTY
jgi:uncharacterized membrane protein YgcG